MKTPALIALLFWCLPVYAAQVSDYPLREVVYDGSNPDLSVAIMGDELLELGSIYENTKVIGFENGSVILHHFENDSAVKCLPSFAPSPKLYKVALELFVYKQMKAIYEAQRAYWDKFGNVYAEDIQTLVHQGFLKGFENGRKKGYFFEIAETGQTRGFTMTPREATFLAVATPETSDGELIFTVNRLGEVRTGMSKTESTWGPVWEYSDHLAEPRQEVVRKI